VCVCVCVSVRASTAHSWLEGQARVFICFEHQFIKKLPVLVSPVILYIEMVARETGGIVCAIYSYVRPFTDEQHVLSEDTEHSMMYQACL
jgi:hypothetical protein